MHLHRLASTASPSCAPSPPQPFASRPRVPRNTVHFLQTVSLASIRSILLNLRSPTSVVAGSIAQALGPIATVPVDLSIGHGVWTLAGVDDNGCQHGLEKVEGGCEDGKGLEAANSSYDVSSSSGSIYSSLAS
ncbi:hypothetical protein KCU86_g36, partial [Aureobasidium melanogenum]